MAIETRETTTPSQRDALGGTACLATTALVVAATWSGIGLLEHAAGASTVLALALLTPGVGPGRRVFLAIGLALAAIALATRPDAPALVAAALGSAAFIVGFFTAQATLRSAAGLSPAMAETGRAVAEQPPGRRYAVLTLGAQLFGLILSYGAISLLGRLAESAARREPDAEIRRHRLRRMLLAIQRGFVSTLPWSPLAFAVVITTALVPGARWEAIVGPCLVSGLIIAGTGWALDTAFKPRLPPGYRRAPASERPWLAALVPLFALLGVLAVGVGALAVAAGLRVTTAVMVIAPGVALGWLWLLHPGAARLRAVAGAAGRFAACELPGFRGELVLLAMAGFIGTLGGRLLAPAMGASGLDLAVLAPWQVHLLLFWIVPLMGQIGMNPILSVSLLAPLLPDPAAIGATPTSVAVAITGGWALSGITSPFTATTLLVGHLGGVSATHVGLRWNAAHLAASGTLLSLWSLTVAWAGL